jgi:hypothetical protein
MKTFENWKEVPNGIILVQCFHERIQRTIFHIGLKLNNDPEYDQPKVPFAMSQEATRDSHKEFWAWAQENLPIYIYPFSL